MSQPLRAAIEMRDERKRTEPQLEVVEDTGPLKLTFVGETVVEMLYVADSMRARMKGLLGRSELEQNEGLLIVPCNSIHMFFMRFPIDAVFLDEHGYVVRVFDHLQPWRMARGGRFAHSVLELPSGKASFYGIQPGAKVSIEPR
jgi:uncharacterized membrane protein (UPF0127 family)